MVLVVVGKAFVLSKQYSDKLSQDVTRGVRRRHSEGVAGGTYKHGYDTDASGRFIPHETNFNLICDAWVMRRDGKSLKAIAKYMNDSGYARTYKEDSKHGKAGQKSFMNDKTLSAQVFPEPFYYGILIQKGKPIDLREIPGYNFQPATDEETYNIVQAMTGRAATERKRKIFKPLVGMVVCDYYQRRMVAQTPLSGRKSEKMRILSYRCDYANCPRKRKELNLSQSVRANVVFDFMYGMLKDFKVTRADYDKLQQRLASTNSAKLQDLSVKIHSKQGALKSIERQVKELSLKIINIDPTSAIYKANEGHINDLEVQREELQSEIAKLQSQLTDPAKDNLSFEEFLNVANNADLHLRAADVAAKDRIARLIYLNVAVDDQKVVDYQIREPFKTYFKLHSISHGRGDKT